MLDESAKDMISNIFDFNDATVGGSHDASDGYCGGGGHHASIQDVVEPLNWPRAIPESLVYHEDLDNIHRALFM